MCILEKLNFKISREHAPESPAFGARSCLYCRTNSELLPPGLLISAVTLSNFAAAVVVYGKASASDLFLVKEAYSGSEARTRSKALPTTSLISCHADWNRARPCKQQAMLIPPWIEGVPQHRDTYLLQLFQLENISWQSRWDHQMGLPHPFFQSRGLWALYL